MVKIKKIDEGEDSAPTGSLLKKNVNLFLMVIVLIIVVAGVGYVSIYQQRLHSVASDAGEKGENLTACSNILDTTRLMLDDALMRLNQTETDVKTYDVIYEKKESELQTKADELEETSSLLSSTSSKLAATEKLFEDAKKKSDDLQKLYDDAQDNIQAKADKIQRLEWQVTCLRGKEDANEGDC